MTITPASKRPFYQFLFEPNPRHLYVVFFLFVISFLVTKVTYFFFYPVWCTTGDIYTYTDPVINLTHHKLPVFDMRTPVFPLFLALTYFTGLSLNSTLFIQMIFSLVTCIISVYVIYKYHKGFFLLFSLVLLLFYSSGDFTAMDTNLSPTSLFSNLILLFAVCCVAGLQSNKRGIFMSASALFAAIILLRPQGLFLLGIIAAVLIIYFVNYRSVKMALPFLLPAIIIYGLLLGYNYATFGLFKYSRFDTLSKLGYIINTIEESPEYPQQMNDIIKDINQTFRGHSKEVICAPGFNFKALDTVYNNDRYSTCWAFVSLIQSNPELVEKLIANSVKSCPQNNWKEFIICFVRYYRVMAFKTNYFYFTELTNRKHYIEGKENFYMFKPRQQYYAIVWRDWMNAVVDHKAGNYPILDPGTDFMKLLKQQPYIVRLINYYEVVFNLVFSNKIWILIYGLSTLIAGLIILFNLFRSSKIDGLLLFPFIPFLNSILVSMIIPPIYYYAYPTRIFCMLSPFIIVFYLLDKRAKRNAEITATPGS